MKLLSFIKSIYLLIALILSLIYFFTLLVIKLFWEQISSKKLSKQKTTHKMAGRWARFFFKSIPGWSIKVNSQLANISDKTYVIVANHESSTDILALYFLNTNFSWLSKIEMFRFPLIGTAMRWLQCIPVKRSSKTSRAKVIKLCEEVINKGLSIVFFPEGTRSTSGKIKEFKMGAFSLSQKTNTPILPVVIKGSSSLLKKGSLVFNKSTVHINVLNPIQPEQDETLSDYTNKVQKLMTEEHQRL